MISFCTSIKNRLWQLKKTLPKNIQLNLKNVTWNIADLASTDGLEDWLWSEYCELIQEGKLNYFRVTSECNWSSPIAKNLAHRIANKNSYLYNLDADNYLSIADYEKILVAQSESAPCHQWSGKWGDGSFGRIGMPAEIFYSLGGYDESFLPMAFQDRDILRRLASKNIKIIELGAPSLLAIQNSISDKVINVTSAPQNAHANIFDQMNQLNEIISNLKIHYGENVRDFTFKSFKGLLNGESVTINGFNELHKS
jgi:hypothetical protein